MSLLKLKKTDFLLGNSVSPISSNEIKFYFNNTGFVGVFKGTINSVGLLIRHKNPNMCHALMVSSF